MQETPTNFKSLVGFIVDFINLLIPVIFAAVFVYLVWKIIDAWVINAGDESKREDGKQYLMSAVITFVVMVSVWGIVAIIRTSVFG